MNIPGGLWRLISPLKLLITKMSPENPARMHRMNEERKNVVPMSPRICHHFGESLKIEA